MSDIEEIRQMVASLEKDCALLLELVQRDAAQLATVTAERDEARRERDELREIAERVVNVHQATMLIGDDSPLVESIEGLAAALNTEGKQE